VDLEQLERALPKRLDALGPAPRAELLFALMLPDLERAVRIGEFWSYPPRRAFAELLIDARRTGRSGRCWLGCCGGATAELGGIEGRAALHVRYERERLDHAPL